MSTTTTSVFDDYRDLYWPHKYHGQITVGCIAGGTPTDPKVTEGWLKSKLAPKDDILRDLVAQTIIERGVTEAEAIDLIDEQRHLNGFKRDEQTGGLYLDGRCLKAALKEAAMVAANEGKLAAKGWGNPTDATYKKGIKGWFPEHVFVLEDRLSLGVIEPTGVAQRFVHTSRGAAIQYEEYIEDAVFDFTVITDHDFSEKQWAAIWLTGEQQGVGASRSQGYGRYAVTEWERL